MRNDLAGKIAVGVLAIGLGIGATVLSSGALGGPGIQVLGATMGWVGLGIGLGDAIATTDAYFVNQAGTNTNLDPSKTLMPQDMKGHWGWVAASWVGQPMLA
jgi:predicted RND superfamily exporter protein